MSEVKALCQPSNIRYAHRSRKKERENNAEGLTRAIYQEINFLPSHFSFVLSMNFYVKLLSFRVNNNDENDHLILILLVRNHFAIT